MHNVVLLVYVILLLFYLGFAALILSVTKKHFPTDGKMAVVRKVFMLGTLILVALSLIFVASNKPDYGKLNFGVNLVNGK